jgi:MFS family permease
VAAGLSQTAGQLIASRAVQGLGVGGVQAMVQIALAAMIPPRARGKYNGYLSGVTAVSTIGGPLLGGVLADTSWLGWRWCFLVGLPFAAIAVVLFRKTLRLPTIRRENVRVDCLGASLIASGVSVLLIWISFVDSSFAWMSAEARELTAQIRTALTSFATSGDPGWPAYDSPQRLTRIFDTSPSVTAYPRRPRAACGRTTCSRRFPC